MKRISIIGATSHVAKGLIVRFAKTDNYQLFLFSRGVNRVSDFLKKESLVVSGNYEYKEFECIESDVILNCIGYGSNSSVCSSGSSLFYLFEKFDNIVLNYLENHPQCLYINFSSGAVYGTNFKDPVNEKSIAWYKPNFIKKEDNYRLSKIYTEAKHRSLTEFKIWDIRIFNYISQFIDLTGRMLITEIICSLIENKTFETDSGNIIRDFVHPDDLFTMVIKIIEKDDGNEVVDLYSKASISKMDLLKELKLHFNLNFSIKEKINVIDATGSKKKYFSENIRAQHILDYYPEYSSRDAIFSTIQIILNSRLEK